MELSIRIFTVKNGVIDTRSILFGEGELEEMIISHLRAEDYLKDDDVVDAIHFENVKL